MQLSLEHSIWDTHDNLLKFDILHKIYEYFKEKKIEKKEELFFY